ncbi:unnamed protein product [Rotaria sp. Silwood1]|nr:unnamed protein product [Rotaria sp. Silwood1]
MNKVQYKPHPMVSGQRLCWLNSSIQLILSNNFLVEALLKRTFFMSATAIMNNNHTININDAKTEESADAMSSFYPIIEQKTIQYLCEILKLPTTKPLKKLTIRNYMEDLRQTWSKIACLQHE